MKQLAAITFWLFLCAGASSETSSSRTIGSSNKEPKYFRAGRNTAESSTTSLPEITKRTYAWSNSSKPGNILVTEDGAPKLLDFTLTPGMSYQVADNAESHRSYTESGAKLFVVD
jgi:hypothetical protein